MTPSCAELGETCAATTVALGIVVFVSATYAAATFRPVMPILIWIGVAATRDATLAKCRCVEARAEKNVLYHSAGVVDTRHFAKIRVSQGDLRSKINRHAPPPHLRRVTFSQKKYIITVNKYGVMWQSLGYGSVASERRSRPLTAESKCIMGYLI